MKLKNLLQAPAANLYDYANYKNFLKYSSLSPNDIILDVGCGTGIMEYILKDKVKKITAIDISQPAINYLMKNFKAKNVNFKCMNINESVPHEFRNAFTKVICIDVLEHMDNPRNLISFIFQVLQDKGQAFITFPINNLTHGNVIRESDIPTFFNSPLPDYKVKFFKANNPLLIRIYNRIRALFPAGEGNSFDNTLSYDLLEKQERSILYKFIYFLIKLIIILFSLLVKNINYEVDTGGTRCLLIINKHN